MRKNRILKALASLRLAVIIIVSLAGLTAWGTFVEADLDATAAQKLVYYSPWMFAVMVLLAVNLIAVMVDRWPWQKHHTGFILAHIGIIILLIGSIITKKLGVDGSITFGIGEQKSFVMSSETDLAVYSSLDGSAFTKIYDREVDFFLNSPTEKKPIEIQIPTGQIKVTNYYPYSFREEKILEGEKDKSGAGVRFQLQNDRVNMTEWILQPAMGRDVTKDLGPAQVVLTSGSLDQPQSKNTILLKPKPGSDEIEYRIYSVRAPASVVKGVAKPGDTIETGWMGMVLRILKYLPYAKQETIYKKTDKPSPMTEAAIEVDYLGKKQWTSLNAPLKLFDENAVYVLAYVNRRLDLGFALHLKDFRIGRYPGTIRAASYESVVEVPGKGDILISMNEPLKHASFTFYQASFESDERGRPVASILSVNRDPGRWLKYLGSLLIVLGSIHLFYFKSRQAKAKKPTPA